MWKDLFKNGRWKRAVCLILCLAPATSILYECIAYPDAAALAHQNPQTTAWMEMRNRDL